jgi:hypothetical protein
LIFRKTTLSAATLACLVSACGGIHHRIKPNMGFRHALQLTRGIRTVTELTAAFGAPNDIATFNPGHRNDPFVTNRFPREMWPRVEIFIPPTLIDTLPIGTKMILNQFTTGLYMSTGALIAYADDKGRIVGWSYSVSLSGESGNRAYLEDLPER